MDAMKFWKFYDFRTTLYSRVFGVADYEFQIGFLIRCQSHNQRPQKLLSTEFRGNRVVSKIACPTDWIIRHLAKGMAIWDW